MQGARVETKKRGLSDVDDTNIMQFKDNTSSMIDMQLNKMISKNSQAANSNGNDGNGSPSKKSMDFPSPFEFEESKTLQFEIQPSPAAIIDTATCQNGRHESSNEDDEDFYDCRDDTERLVNGTHSNGSSS